MQPDVLHHTPLHHLHALDLRKPQGWWLLLSFWGSHEHHHRCVTREKNYFPFVLGTAAESPESSSRSYLQLRRPHRDDRRSIRLAVKAAVRCLLLTANAADNKHHALAKSRSMFETSTQKTDRRHPTPFPNTNDACQLQVCMIYNSRFNAQHTQPASDRGRPGLRRHLLAHSG